MTKKCEKYHNPDQCVYLRLAIRSDYELAAARYVFHKVNIKRYADAVNLGVVMIGHDGAEVVVKMPHEQAKEMYRMAMENYDGIIKNAASGASGEANQASMDEGFKI